MPHIDPPSVTVFCGASAGNDPRYVAAAEALAEVLADRGLGLVYGGGRTGMMGALADAALAAGVPVTGVIPEALAKKEVAHDGLQNLVVVDSMHERKTHMALSAGGFIALPGGLGTLEELCEILTWLQLGIHDKPVGLLNVAGYFDPLLAMLDQATSAQFLRQEDRDRLVVSSDASDLVDALIAQPLVEIEPRWMDFTQS